MSVGNKHLSRDPQLSSVTRNSPIYSIQFDTLKTEIFKLKEFMNFIIVRRNICWTIYAVLFLQTFVSKIDSNQAQNYDEMLR